MRDVRAKRSRPGFSEELLHQTQSALFGLFRHLPRTTTADSNLNKQVPETRSPSKARYPAFKNIINTRLSTTRNYLTTEFDVPYHLDRSSRMYHVPSQDAVQNPYCRVCYSHGRAILLVCSADWCRDDVGRVAERRARAVSEDSSAIFVLMDAFSSAVLVISGRICLSSSWMNTNLQYSR